MIARELLSSLKGVKRNGDGWLTLCPGHDDHSPSLSIRDGENGGVVLYCFAGCSFERVCSALGIDAISLRPGETTGPGLAPPQAITNSPQTITRKPQRIVSSYNYEDESGNLSFQVLRCEPKSFQQRRPDGEGGWIRNLKGVRQLPYRLPELLAADSSSSVFITEGEKDADRLAALGLVATTNPGGAGKWRDEYNEALSGRDVCVLPDNDIPGREHGEKVAASVRGVAANVRVLVLPNLPEKGDVSDWLDAGGTAEELARLAACAPIRHGDSRMNIAGFTFTPLDELLEEPEEEVAYAWDKTLPRSGFSIIAAKPKVGKSTLARNLAVAVSRGESFFGRATLKGKVICLCLEEKRSELRKHFERMGATGKDILIYTGRTPEDALTALADAIKEHAPVLVIIDPLARFVRLADFNNYAEVTRGLEPLIDLARESECQCHVLALHHNGKSDREAGDALLGSTGFFGAVDSLLTMKRKQQVRTLETVQRYGEDIPETVVRLDSETGLVSPDGDVQTLLLNERKDAVLDCLVDEALTEPEIKLRIQGNQGLTSRALRALYKEGLLSRSGAGKRGDAFRYCKIGGATEGGNVDSGFVGLPIQVNPLNPENRESENGRNDSVGLHLLPAVDASIEFEEGFIE